MLQGLGHVADLFRACYAIPDTPKLCVLCFVNDLRQPHGYFSNFETGGWRHEAPPEDEEGFGAEALDQEVWLHQDLNAFPAVSFI